MWFTPISGTPRAKLSDLAYVSPTSSDPTRPGPTVAAMAARLSSVVPADSRASRTTSTMARRCSRDASSGTTPPYLPCVAICEATTEESTRSASSTTAAAVSSHDDSMPRIRTSPVYDGLGFLEKSENDRRQGPPALRSAVRHLVADQT